MTFEMVLRQGSPEHEPFEQIVQQMMPQGRLRRVWPLVGGMSAQMHGLEIALPDGGTHRVVVRRFDEGNGGGNWAAAAREFHLLQITHAAGLPVPKPYHLDSSRQIFPTPYLVMEFVAGEMLFAPVDVPAHVTQLATHQANIHRLKGAAFDFSFLGEPVFTCAEMARPAVGGALFGEIDIRALLATHSRAHASSRAPSLLHGDFWPGNSLWRNGQLVAVIDWEDALWGDPLLDVARSRSEIAWIFGLDAMAQFTAQYQAILPFAEAELPYWDLCAALRQIRLFQGDLVAAAAFFTPYHRPDITAASIQRDYEAFIGQAVAKIGL